MNKSPKYMFIHSTKCGGTALEDYFSLHYPTYIQGFGHKRICTLINKPIFVVREPQERFLSMYNYWKNGSISGKFVRKSEFIKQYSTYTIKDFIQLLETNSEKDLHYGFTWDVHFKPQTFWIKPNVYEKTIIIEYTSDLNPTVHKLLYYLGIPDKNIVVPMVNVTKKEADATLDADDIAWIRKRYASDYELWNDIHYNKHLFKHVINAPKVQTS